MNVPAVQLVQTLLPSPAPNVPGRHSAQAVLPSADTRPTAQSWQTVFPDPVTYRPAVHIVHVVLRVTAVYRPSSQKVQAEVA